MSLLVSDLLESLFFSLQSTGLTETSSLVNQTLLLVFVKFALKQMSCVINPNKFFCSARQFVQMHRILGVKVSSFGFMSNQAQVSACKKTDMLSSVFPGQQPDGYNWNSHRYHESQKRHRSQQKNDRARVFDWCSKQGRGFRQGCQWLVQQQQLRDQ